MSHRGSLWRHRPPASPVHRERPVERRVLTARCSASSLKEQADSGVDAPTTPTTGSFAEKGILMRFMIRLAVSLTVVAGLLVAAGATTADAGRYWWVISRVHSPGIVQTDGLVQVDVTYRCLLPRGNIGSTEVYSTLRQHPGRPNEVSDDRLDVDEFWCDGAPHVVPHLFSSETAPFHRGKATLSLDIRVCTGDVTDDPGACIHRIVEAEVRLHRGLVPGWS